jgi:hypothetical protein
VPREFAKNDKSGCDGRLCNLRRTRPPDAEAKRYSDSSIVCSSNPPESNGSVRSEATATRYRGLIRLGRGPSVSLMSQLVNRKAPISGTIGLHSIFVLGKAANMAPEGLTSGQSRQYRARCLALDLKPGELFRKSFVGHCLSLGRSHFFLTID